MRAGVSHTNSLLMERQNNRESVKSTVQDTTSWCSAHWSLLDTRRRQNQHSGSEWIKAKLKDYLSLRVCHLILVYWVHRDTKSSERDGPCLWTSRREIKRNVSSNSILLLAAHARSKKNCKTSSVVTWQTVCPETGTLLVQSTAGLNQWLWKWPPCLALSIWVWSSDDLIGQIKRTNPLMAKYWERATPSQ